MFRKKLFPKDKENPFNSMYCLDCRVYIKEMDDIVKEFDRTFKSHSDESKSVSEEYKNNKKDSEDIQKVLTNKNLLVCSNPGHNWPLYENRFKIPKKFMRANPDNKSSVMRKTCVHCRLRRKQTYQRSQERKRIIIGKLPKEDKKYGYCTSSRHSDKISPYEWYHLPSKKLRKKPSEPLGPKNRQLNTCIDCRNEDHEAWRKRLKIGKVNAKLKGLFFCSSCFKTTSKEERAINIDGTKSKYCILCKYISLKYYRKKVEDSNLS